MPDTTRIANKLRQTPGYQRGMSKGFVDVEILNVKGKVDENLILTDLYALVRDGKQAFIFDPNGRMDQRSLGYVQSSLQSFLSEPFILQGPEGATEREDLLDSLARKASVSLKQVSSRSGSGYKVVLNSAAQELVRELVHTY